MMLSRTTQRSTSSLLRPSCTLKTDITSSPQQEQHQRRTIVGLVHAIDKRVYRWAKGVLPPISKTENIALGCGTIGECLMCDRNCSLMAGWRL